MSLLSSSTNDETAGGAVVVPQCPASSEKEGEAERIPLVDSTMVAAAAAESTKGGTVVMENENENDDDEDEVGAINGGGGDDDDDDDAEIVFEERRRSIRTTSTSSWKKKHNTNTTTTTTTTMTIVGKKDQEDSSYNNKVDDEDEVVVVGREGRGNGGASTTVVKEEKEKEQEVEVVMKEDFQQTLKARTVTVPSLRTTKKKKKRTQSVVDGTNPPSSPIQAQEAAASSSSSASTAASSRLPAGIVWRDFTFLILGGLALKIVSYVETNAAYNSREVPFVVCIIQSLYYGDCSGDGGGGGGGEAITTEGGGVVGTGGSVAGEAATTPSGSYATEDDIFSPSSSSSPGSNIIDAGFVLTTPLYIYLSQNRSVNDLLAFLNSLLLLFPSLYVTYITAWVGDYTLSFRLLATQLFRSFCGWFTYLPPDPTFLMSIYDFPEIAQCMFGEECGSSVELEPLPFVSFFSGHVASTVIVANHMYLRGKSNNDGRRYWRRIAVGLHVFNIFQIVRLLATRGHYSIDIIIGWVVAVYVSNPAERLGRYYSRGVGLSTFLPDGPKEAFETVIGLHDIQMNGGGARGGMMTTEDRLWLNRHGYRGSLLDRRGGPDAALGGGRGLGGDDADDVDDDMYYVEGSTTAAKVVAQMASQWAQKSLAEMQTELERHGLAAAELRKLRRRDLIQLLAWAQLKMDELLAEARRMDVKVPVDYYVNNAKDNLPSMPRMDLLVMMLGRTRSVMEQRAQRASEWAQRNIVELRAELERHGMRAQEIHELRRKDLLHLLGWAQLKVDELREEARKMDLTFDMEEELISRRDMIASMWERTKSIMEERGKVLAAYSEECWDAMGEDDAIESM